MSDLEYVHMAPGLSPEERFYNAFGRWPVDDEDEDPTDPHDSEEYES